MSRALARRLRLWLLPMLVLGVLLRPVLIIACDVHAALHGHADAPHVHLADEPGAKDKGDTHGDHDWLQGATAAEVPAHLTMYTLPAAPAPHLRPMVRDESPPPDPGRGVPFRPPIA